MLDTIHGALTLARRMDELGMKADALEVYHHSPSVADYDLVVAPVHLGPKNPVLIEARRLGKGIITHHQAAGELLCEEDTDIRIIEVTGTHSKTTTALLAARILSRQKKVLSHTTRGLELWTGGESRTLGKGLSITPANVIAAFNAARAQDVDVLVSEISLGGTGLADIGILTSFSGDYRIAGQSAWASTAKLQMASLAKPGSRLLSASDVKISSDLTFGPAGRVRAERECLHFGDRCVSLQLDPSLDFPSYQTAISAASAAAWEMGLSPEEISEALCDFNGVSGRMKVSCQGSLTVYDCSNSGLKLSDVRRALDLVAGGRLGMVVGEDAETVCEGMDVPGLVDLLARRRNEIAFLVLVGERLLPFAEDLKARTAPDLSAGLSLVRKEGSEADRLLSCVKCFR